MAVREFTDSTNVDWRVWDVDAHPPASGHARRGLHGQPAGRVARVRVRSRRSAGSRRPTPATGCPPTSADSRSCAGAPHRSCGAACTRPTPGSARSRRAEDRARRDGTMRMHGSPSAVRRDANGRCASTSAPTAPAPSRWCCASRPRTSSWSWRGGRTTGVDDRSRSSRDDARREPAATSAEGEGTAATARRPRGHGQRSSRRGDRASSGLTARRAASGRRARG